MGYHLHSVTVVNGFNRGSRGIVAHDFVRSLSEVTSTRATTRCTETLARLGGSSSGADRLSFSHTVDNRNLTVRAGHRDDVLLVGTRTVQAGEVISYSEGIGRSGSSSRSFRFGVLRGSGSTGSGLELNTSLYFALKSSKSLIELRKALVSAVGFTTTNTRLLPGSTLKPLVGRMKA